MSRESITPELLREILRYEPATGRLYWRERGIENCISEHAMKAFNAQFAGKEAFTSDNGDGYLCSHMRGKTLRAHRVIWAIVYGYWPSLQIDHVNGIRSDNRLCNLREASPAQNAHNQKRNNRNTSGYRGVSKIKRTGRWQARITLGGKRMALGIFDSAHEAHLAYCAASKKYHGEFGRAL